MHKNNVVDLGMIAKGIKHFVIKVTKYNCSLLIVHC